MIQNSTQHWKIGATVRVGFLSLVVKATIRTPGDWLPDSYILTNQAGTKLYNFIPHNGLHSLTIEEAQDLLEANSAVAEREAEALAQDNALRADISRLFA